MTKHLPITLLLIAMAIKLQAQFTPTVTMNPNVSATRPMPPNVGGSNSANIIQTGESLGDECVKKTIKNTGGEDLRFPPGTTGGYWDFQRGGFMEAKFLPEGWTQPTTYSGPPLANTLKDFKLATDTAMSRILINMNLLTSDRNFQRASAFAAKYYNIKISGFELGNELYGGLEKDPQFTFRFPTAKIYADSCNAWAAYLKATFPNVLIASLGAVPVPEDPARFQNWLSDILGSAGSNIDAVTLHKYSGSGLPVGSIDTATNDELKPMFKQAFQGPLETIVPLLDQIESAGKKAWITEFNLFDKERVVHGSWAHGLFVGAQVLSYLRNPVVTKTDCHTLLGTGVFAAIFSDANGFNYADGFMSPNVNFNSIPCELTASGNALSLVLAAIRNSTTSQLIRLNGDMPPNLAILYPSVVGVRYIKPTGKDALIMNLSPEIVNFTTDPVFSNVGGTYEMIWGTPQNFIKGNATAAAPTISTLQKLTGTFTGAPGETIALKPYSIIRFSSAPAVQIVSSVDTVCNGTYGTLKAYGKGPFTWTSNEPGWTIIQGDVINVEFNAGSPIAWYYTATVTGTNIFATKTINFYSPRILTIREGTTSISDKSICAGTSVTLNADITGSSPNKKYAWTRSEDINNPSAQTVTITPKEAVNKYILYATDGVCWNLTDTVTIRLKGLAKAGNDTTVCNASAFLKSQVIETGNVYEWRVAPYTSVLASVANFTVTSPPIGSTTYRLQVTNGTCTSFDFKVINNYNCCAAANTLAMAPYSNINDLVANGNSPSLTSYLNATKDTLTGYPNDIYFNGPFFVNQDFTFINCPKLKFGENATLNVGNYRKLNIVNSTLGACSTKLWEGIKTLTSMCGLNVVNSTIKESKMAVETRQNAVIGLRGSTFMNNYNNLTARDYTIAYPDSIYANTFTINALLLAGAPGNENICKSSINIINSTDFGIGNPVKSFNTMFGSNWYGVDCINSGATIVNNKFSYNNTLPFGLGETYTQAPNAGNAFVHAINTSNTLKTINIGGGNSSLMNTFGVCKLNGVYIEGNLRSNISFNTFSNFNKGIKIYNPLIGPVIKGNTFNSNYYVNTTNAVLNRECTAVDISLTTYTTLKLSILDNTINNCRMGVYMSNVNGSTIKGNFITLNKPGTGTQSAHYGINLLTCGVSAIETNTINTDAIAFGALTSSQRQGYQGVFLNTVSNSNIKDNDLTRFGNHISLLNGCNATTVTCNRFYRGGNTGIYNSSAELLQTIKLTNATIGNLGTTSASANNEWDGNYSTANVAQNYRVAGSTGGATPNYYKLNTDPAVKLPNPYFVTGLGLQLLNATAGNICNPGIPAIVLDNNDGQFENADLSKDNELGDTTLMVEAILDYDPIFDSTNTAAGYFADLAIYNLGQILIDSGYVDSVLVADAFQGTDIANIMELNNALMYLDSTTIANLCNELEGNEIVIQNIKAMNAFLNKCENYCFTSADSSVINGIAYQKVQVAGPAAVSARNWLGIYLVDSELPSTPKSLIQGAFENNWNVKVYPNPSKGMLRVESEKQERLNLVIFDHIGKIVSEINNVQSGSTLEIKNLSNGVYNIQIASSNGEQKYFKWSIEK